MWRQYQGGGGQGGMDVQGKDPNGNFVQAAWRLQDTAGQYINYMTTQYQWVNRVVDLTPMANDVVTSFLLFVNSTTPAGSTFDIFHSNIAILSLDGTVTTLYAGQRGTSIPNTYNYGNNGSNLSGVQETVNAGPASPDNTFYFHGDHLGSARLITYSKGWPVSSDTFHPFGLEPSGTASTNHYRYASLERDAESGFDHADFRQLASAQGRWMSPDPYDGSYDPSNPQSFNRYSYVLNNPMSYVDPSGLDYGYDCGPNCVGVVATDDNVPWYVSEYGYSYTGNYFWGGSVTAYTPPAKTTPTTTTTAPKKSIAGCAAKFASAHSIAGGLQALGIGSHGGIGGFLTNTFGGNTIAGLYNLGSTLTSSSSTDQQVLTQMGKAYLRGPLQGIPSGLVGAGGTPFAVSPTGIVRGAAVGAAFNAVTGANDSLITLSGEVGLSTVGTTAAEFATGVGEAKFALDFLTFAYGVGTCIP